jgi:hypothetical protein
MRFALFGAVALAAILLVSSDASARNYGRRVHRINKHIHHINKHSYHRGQYGYHRGYQIYPPGPQVYYPSRYGYHYDLDRAYRPVRRSHVIIRATR